VTKDPFSCDPTADIVVNSIHCEPNRLDKYRNIVPGQFDTAVINYRDGGWAGVKGVYLFYYFCCNSNLIGYYVGRVHCVFMLPLKARKA
jgi:hypothetical protein